MECQGPSIGVPGPEPLGSPNQQEDRSEAIPVCPIWDGRGEKEKTLRHSRAVCKHKSMPPTDTVVCRAARKACFSYLGVMRQTQTLAPATSTFERSAEKGCPTSLGPRE